MPLRRRLIDIQADEVAPSLLRATAVVTKTTGAPGAIRETNGWDQRPAADSWNNQQDQAPF